MAEPRFMLVEGKDDEHAVRNLFAAAGRPSLYHLRALGGYHVLRASIPTFLKASDLRCLAIVVDADTDPAARWQSLRDVLVGVGYAPAATLPPGEGLVLPGDGERVAVGVWLMPDNAKGGMLEDFAAALIDDADPLWPRARRAVADIPPDERRFGPTAVGKAEIHTWLAWQADPGLSIGAAIKNRWLDAARPHGAAFLAWAERLVFLGEQRAR